MWVSERVQTWILYGAVAWWKAKWISAWYWWGMSWDAGQDCGTDEGKARCDGAVESRKSDAVGREDE